VISTLFPHILPKNKRNQPFRVERTLDNHFTEIKYFYIYSLLQLFGLVQALRVQLPWTRRHCCNVATCTGVHTRPRGRHPFTWPSLRTFGAHKMLSKRGNCSFSVASKPAKTASEILGFAALNVLLGSVFRSSRTPTIFFTMFPLTHSLTFKHLTNLTSKLLQNTGQNLLIVRMIRLRLLLLSVHVKHGRYHNHQMLYVRYSVQKVGCNPCKIFICKVAAWEHMDNVGWLVVFIRHVDNSCS